MQLFRQLHTVHEIYDCVLLVTTCGGVTAVRNAANHYGLRPSKLALSVAGVLAVMNIVHAVLVPRSIDTIVEENESLVYATSTADINRNDPDFIMKLLNSMSVSLTALASRLLTITRMKHHLPKIIDGLAEVDTDLRLDRRVLQQNGRYVYLMIICLLCLCIPLQLISIFVLEPLDRFFVTLMFTVNAYNNFTIACCEFQFVILTYLVATRLGFINDKLNAYGKVQRHTFLIEQISDWFNLQLLLSIACCNLNTLISVYFAIFGGYYKPEDVARAAQKP